MTKRIFKPLALFLAILTVSSTFLFLSSRLQNTAQAVSPTSFFDHFASGPLDARWLPVTAGSGQQTISDSNLNCSSAQSGDACTVLSASKLDKTTSQLWVFAISDVTSTFPQSWVSLVNSASTPSPMTSAGWNPLRRILVSTANQGGTNGIVFSYWDTNHLQKQWNGTNNTWTSSSALADKPIAGNDYYLIGLENDAANNRWRLMAWAKRSTNGNYTFDQGLRLFSLTDWVSWSAMEVTSDLWLALGEPLTDVPQGNLAADWVRLDAGPRRDVWSNGKGSQGDAYVIRHGWGYEGESGGVEMMVQEDRSILALNTGPSGSWDSAQVKDPYVFFDPTTNLYYLLYSGSSSSGGFQVGLATSSSPNGAFTRYGTTPLIARIPNTPEGNVFNPAVVKDHNDPDPNKLFKMLYTGFDGNFRIFLATAPAITGPWTRQGIVMDVGQAGAFDQNGYSRARPVFSNNQWYVFASAKNNSEPGQPFRVSYATGPTLSALTLSNNILVNSGLGPKQNITAAVSGRTVKVGNTAGFLPDAYLEIDQDSNANNYGQSRIRKVVDATTLELYHGWDGFTTSTPAKVVQVDGANRIEIADVSPMGNKWFMYVTPFGLFGPFAPILSAHDENTGLLISDSITGPYSWDHLATPPFSRGSWQNQVSNENLSLVHLPTNPPPPPPPPPPDSIPPTVSVTSPVSQQTVSGLTTLSADASDNIAIASVQFKIDGNNVGSPVTSAPYNLPWDSGTVLNGGHSVSALATDTSNNSTESIPVPFNVFNNKALQFDGVDDIVVSQTTASPPSQMTINAWIKPSTLGEGMAGHIFAIRNDATNNPNIQLRLVAGNAIRFLAIFNNGGGISAGFWTTANNSVVLNGLQHVVVVYDGTSASNVPTIYINNVPQSLTVGGTPVGTLNTGATFWRIGNNPALTATFQGVIDEVQIYGRLLNAAEVGSLYNNGVISTGSQTGVVGGWHLDEGTGTVAGDFSGNNKTVDLINGPGWVNL